MDIELAKEILTHSGWEVLTTDFFEENLKEGFVALPEECRTIDCDGLDRILLGVKNDGSWWIWTHLVDTKEPLELKELLETMKSVSQHNLYTLLHQGGFVS